MIMGPPISGPPEVSLGPCEGQRSSGGSRAPVGLVFQRQLLAALVAVLMMGIAMTKHCSCNRLQDEQQQRAVAAAAAAAATEQSSSPIDQVPIYGAGDYSALIGDNLINLGQPLFNGKRARKMSGFMPMRGRKDGRDQQQQQQQQLEQRFYLPTLQATGEEMVAGGNPFRDNDGEASVLRFVAAGSTPEGLRWLNARQAQFANQFAAQHLLASGEAPAGRAQQQRASSSVVGESLESSPDSGQQSLVMLGDSMMQAKLRRAFHPMRGKKSYAIEPAGYADELQPGVDST